MFYASVAVDESISNDHFIKMNGSELRGQGK